MANFREEFPDYPVDAMPAMPHPSFGDASWGNEMCPCFASDPLGLEIWVDYPNPDDREFPGMSRFRVFSQRDGIETSDGPFLDTDDWTEVCALVERQARP